MTTGESKMEGEICDEATQSSGMPHGLKQYLEHGLII